MRYAVARLEIAQREAAYEVYVTDMLRMIAENTARSSGGSYTKKRFVDVVTPQKPETRTKEDVIERMKSVLGRMAVENEPI